MDEIPKIIYCIIFLDSQVDIAYAPFIERFRPFLLEVKTYDITAGRPKLAAWIEVLKISF